MDDLGDYSKRGEGWRAILFDFDKYAALPDNSTLYCLTDKQVWLLLAMCEYTRWRTRWISPTGAAISQGDLDDAHGELLEALMTDKCAEILAALDDIGTDITTINTNITTINTDITTINNTLVDVQNTLIVIDNSITNINVQINNTTIINVTNTYFTFSANVNDTTATAMYARYNALCQNILDWINSECYIILANNGASSSDLLTVLGQLTAGISQPLAGLLFHGQGAYTVLEVLDAVTNGTDVNAVACYMITYLAQLPMSFEAFSASLAAFTPANFNQTVLKDILTVALAYGDAYTGFVTNMQAEFELAYALAPTDFTCPACTPSGFCSVPYTWDFSQLQLIPWTIRRGTLEAGVGIVGKAIPGDTNVTYEIVIDFPTPCTAILGHRFKMTTRVLPTSVGNPSVIEWYYLLGGVLTRYSGGGFVPATGSWPAFTETAAPGLNVPTPPGGVGVAQIRIHGNTAYYGFGTAGLTANDLQAFKFVT